MSALQVMIDGVFTAAELIVLLFASPVAAAEAPRTDSPAHRPAFSAAREAHLLSSSFDVRLLGSLADVRVSQHFRNDHAEPVNLALRLPPVDEYTDALRVHRRGRSVELLQLDSGCGGDGDDDLGDADPTSGHVQLAVDESIADALQLAPGEKASIELIATLPLSRVGMAFQMALPEHAAIESQALLINQSDEHSPGQFLVVVPHRAARGTTRLTLRPDRGVTETIELGVLSTPVAYVIPLADRTTLQSLSAGAIELETRSAEGVVWSTLPTRLRSGTSVTLAGTAE